MEETDNSKNDKDKNLKDKKRYKLKEQMQRMYVPTLF